jgi:hypothetical protein
MDKDVRDMAARLLNLICTGEPVVVIWGANEVAHRLLAALDHLRLRHPGLRQKHLDIEIGVALALHVPLDVLRHGNDLIKCKIILGRLEPMRRWEHSAARCWTLNFSTPCTLYSLS